MIKILASDFNHYHKENGVKIANAFDNTNGIVDQIKNSLKKTDTILFIASAASDEGKISLYASLLFEGLRLSGITFQNYLILDNQTANEVASFINRSDMIFLSGGSTFQQNCFFKKINLKEHLSSFDGLIIGQSAGALNMADDVFNSPEEMTESEPTYFSGLDLTTINIEPHFVEDGQKFTDAEVFQRKSIITESYKRTIYGQCNGSHIFIDENNQATIYGKTYLISNGEISLVCENTQSAPICKAIKLGK